MAIDLSKLDWRYEIKTEPTGLSFGAKWVARARVWEQYAGREIEKYPQEVYDAVGDTEEDAYRKLQDKAEAWLAKLRKERDSGK